MRTVNAFILAAGILFGGSALAETYNLKLGHWVPQGHPMSVHLQKWADALREESGGELNIEVFPAGQLGPVPAYYDMVRRGTIDIGWILHGATSDRFPLTSLLDIPFTVGSAEIATKVLNEPEIRAHLDKEHRGLKVLYLFAHTPAQIHTAGKGVKRPEDLSGMRIRFPSATARQYIEALGGSPVGLPPTEIAESLQKKTIDGVVIDYSGAGIAFKLGGAITHSTELYAYSTTFGLVMNPAAFERLPENLQKLIEKSTSGEEVHAEVGRLWDGMDEAGQKALADGGMQVVHPSAEDMARFRKVGADVGARIIAEREASGAPAKDVAELMRAAAKKHEGSSFSFWKE